MKNLFYILLMASLIGLSASGCSKDDDAANPTHKVPDPEGTVELNMRNYDNGDTQLLSSIYIDEGNNFYCRNFYWHVIDLGEMKGLGNITQYTSPVPSNRSAAAIPGHGYLFYFDNRPESVTWMRLYVDSYIVNILDEIIGVRVKYQEPFLPANPQAINNQVADVVAQE